MDKFPAKYVVFWPGQEIKVCENHAQQLQAMNKAMGSGQLSMRSLEQLGESGECINCINENIDNE